ncbi:MAG: PDZ domain-containing protein [Thermoanaerobaculia bacterium]|nr:PDZ domain-containing protein [Thermoanaerobaculia bacterium]
MHCASPSPTPSPSHRAVSVFAAPALTVLLVWGLMAVFEVAVGGPRASGQEMMRFSSDDTLMIREIGAILESTDDGVRVAVAMPAEARPEAYRDVDVREGDVILVINGRRIREFATARELLEQAEVGDEIALGIDRDGRSVIVRFPKADPSSLPDRMVYQGPGGGHAMAVESQMMIGGEGVDLTPVMGLGVILEGDGEEPETVTVSVVLPIVETTLQEGDVLKSLGGEAVTSAAAVAESVEALDVGADIQLVVVRGDEEVTVTQAKSAAQGSVRIRRQ